MTNPENKKELPVTITDLLDIIHTAVIINKGVNDVIREDLNRIAMKIQSGELQDYEVNKVPLFGTIVNSFN